MSYYARFARVDTCEASVLESYLSCNTHNEGNCYVCKLPSSAAVRISVGISLVLPSSSFAFFLAPTVLLQLLIIRLLASVKYCVFRHYSSNSTTLSITAGSAYRRRSDSFSNAAVAASRKS